MGEELTDQTINNILGKCGNEITDIGVVDLDQDSTIIACGDFHGDLQACETCLIELAQVVEKNDNRYKWIGKPNTYVVIVGDMVDRKRLNQFDGLGEEEDDEIKILRLVAVLDFQARRSNSRVMKCYGNHEMMNLTNDFRFATTELGKRQADYEIGGRARNAMAACGMYGVVKIGDWIFTHGGIGQHLAQHLKSQKEKETKYQSQDDRPFTNIHDDFVNETNKIGKTILKQTSFPRTEQEKILYHPSFASKRGGQQLSILWNREYGDVQESKSLCQKAKYVMKVLNFDEERTRFVVAHTHQYFRQFYKDRGYILYGSDPIVEKDRVIYSGEGRLQHPSDYCGTSINYACPIPGQNDGQIWRIDVGMSRAFDIKDVGVVKNKKVLTYQEIIKDPKHKDTFKKAIRLRRPQILMVKYKHAGRTYKPRVIMSRYDLPRGWVPKGWLDLHP